MVTWRKKWQPVPAFLPGEFHGQKPPSMESQRVEHDWVNKKKKKKW